MGAGLLPFTRHDGETLFLLQRPYGGRKAGFLVDFGGGSDPGETPERTAIREFVEETDGLCLPQDGFEAQIAWLTERFEAGPVWSCRRDPGPKNKDWRTFFVEIPWFDAAPLNRAWIDDGGERFGKPRRLQWISAADLDGFYASEPEGLWKRLRELVGARRTIAEIVSGKGD